MNITDPRFVYIPADTDSNAFRERQKQRMAEAQRAKAGAVPMGRGVDHAASSPPIPLLRKHGGTR